MSPPAESGRPSHLRRSRHRAPSGDGASASASASGNREDHNDGYGDDSEEGDIDNTPSHRRPSRGRRPSMSRDTPQRRVSNQRTLLGLLAATMLATYWFCWRWAGDPRVNIWVSKLGPDDIDIVSAPSPLTDLITIADTAMNASLYLYLPHRISNITLTLDAPGLPRLDVASWLPRAQVRELVSVQGEFPYHKMVRPLKAEHAPLVVSLANTTLTLELMETLWPVLLHAASDLLFFGLTPEHFKYHHLNETLAEPQGRELISLVRAGQIWGDLYRMARVWPWRGRSLLVGTGYEIQSEAEERAKTTKGRRDGSNRASGPNIGSAQLPDARELLQHARRSLAPGRTLPGYLASLRPPSNTSIQFGGMLERLTKWPKPGYLPSYYVRSLPRDDGGLWMDTRGLCRTGEPLRETAEGRCGDPERAFTYITYDVPVDVACVNGDCIPALRDALCDAEEFLPSVAAAAERVRAAVVKERGTPTLLTRLLNYFHADDIETRIRGLDGALAAFHALYPALKIQRQILAGVAARLQRVCDLQDTLRHRVRSALSDQSWWWDLEWDADREKVVLAYAMLPEIEDTVALLNNASNRIGDEDTAIWELEDFLKQAVKLLKTEVSAGWVERLGLGHLRMPRRPVRVKPRQYPWL